MMMMMKGLIIQQQQVPVILDESMSNLTCASGDQASGSSSGNRTENASTYSLQYFDPAPNQPMIKKKRNLPGNPDPEAEVIALSPKTLMATNRFVCEICKKGFQRDQNLQLHRRGHNLPWKLKQRSGKEARKKVYVCPEGSCVHHDPSRALGDLTGVKKHFCRKHGEKKWKCDKCSKKYAVQTDWKAHSKTCGTRDYRCDCGTLFSRRDSFITHRAFCDALAEESTRAITRINPLLSSQPPPQFVDLHHSFSLKQTSFPPWLACPTSAVGLGSGSDTLPCIFTETGPSPCPNPSSTDQLYGPTFPAYHPTASAHMSATALLQKAAQMCATIGSSSKAPPCSSELPAAMAMRAHQAHVSANSGCGLHFSSHDHHQDDQMIMGLGSFENKDDPAGACAGGLSSSSAFLQDTMILNSLYSSSSGFDYHHGSTFDQDPLFGCILDAKKEDDDHNQISNFDHQECGNGGGNDGMTRDFLGLRALSHSDIMSIAGLGNCINATATSPSKPNP